MANVGTSTVAYATQQPTGSLVFIASDGTACVLWNDGTNQKFSYASSPYSSWTTTTLITGLNMALAGRFRAGSDNIDVVTGASTTVRPNYYPLTKISATYSLGTANQISTTAAGTSAVGNVMQYCGQDPQGRHWIVCGGASTYTAETGYFSPANAPTTAGWTASPSTAVAQTGDVNLPAGDQVGNFILRIWWNGTALQYSRADNSASTIGAWAAAATIPNLTGSPNASSRVVFRALSATQALLVYSTGTGIYAQTYTPATNTFSAATQLSTNASDRHPTIATDGAGNAWVVWCSFAAANSYALVYKRWNGSAWDTSATTLVASGTNIANPSTGFGNFSSLGVAYTVGTANPFTVGWITATFPTTSTRSASTSAALSQTKTRTITSSCALSSPDWYTPGYRYKKQITLNHAQVSGGSDLSSFPVLVTFTDPDLKTVASGGKVQNASGFDLIFLDSTQTTQLDHEIEKYDGVAGTITAWVRVPLLSASVDTSIYLLFGNSSVSLSHENKSEVWNPGGALAASSVWHFLENPAGVAPQMKDSGATNHLTSSGTWTAGQQVAGQIDGSLSFNGTDNSEQAPNASSLKPPGDMTFSVWVNFSTTPSVKGEDAMLAYKNNTVAPWFSYQFTIEGASGNVAHFYWTNTTSSTYVTIGTTALAASTWYHLAYVKSGTTAKMYLNGVDDTGSNQVSSGTLFSSDDLLYLGAVGASKHVAGQLDEMRLFGVARSAGWLLTEYHNQQAPGTFCTPGATTLVSRLRTVPLSVSLSSAFVTRSGTQLFLNGAAFRFAGANCYWLGLREVPSISYPPQFEVDDALATVKEMGETVVRSMTLGISVGNSLSVETSLGTFNDSAFAPMDYAIKKAGDLGIKLIIPLCDNWNYYHGGKSTFTTWRGLSDENLFFTDSTVISDFEAYISHILSHVNTLTGIAYKDDPTIMAWETGSELTSAPSSWTSTIAAYIKSVDSRHLISCGYAMSAVSGSVVATDLTNANLDIFSDHLYPCDTTIMSTDQGTVTTAGKVYAMEEFQWIPNDQTAGTLTIDTATHQAGSQSGLATITVGAPNAPYFLQVHQDNLAVVGGKTYTISFYAKADIARNVDVVVQLSNSPYTLIMQQTIALSTSWAQYTLPTYTPAASTTVFLGFNVAQNTGSIWFDEVSVAADAGNLVLNPGFESATVAPWTLNIHTKTGVDMSTLLTAIEGNTNVVGDLYWDLFPHAVDHGFVIHNDGYSLYYPGQTSDYQTRMQTLRTHAYTMAGLTAPAALTLAAPTNLSVVSGVVSWTGTIGAKTYDVERSTTGSGSGYSVIGTGLTDFSTPWTDTTAGSFPSKWYRVRGYNVDAVAGPYSSVVFVGSPTRTVGSSVALIGTNTRTIPASTALLLTKSRTMGATLATLATGTRTAGTSTALLSTPSRTMGNSTALIGTLTRSMGATLALIQARTRTLGTSTALGLTSSRQAGSTAALLSSATRTIPTSTPLQSQVSRTVTASVALSITRLVPTSTPLVLTQTRTLLTSSALVLTRVRTIPTSGALIGQASRSIPITGALSITRIVPTSTALSLTQMRTIPASVPLLQTSTRQVTSTLADLATITRTVPASAPLQGQVSRTVSVTGALSITRIVPISTALLSTSNRVASTTAVVQQTSTRILPVTGALLSQFSRSLGTSSALLASLSRSAGASVALLQTRTRTISVTSALSLTGTATRTIPVTSALLASTSRSIGTSAALGTFNVSRIVPVTSAILQQASRTIPVSAPLLQTGNRQVPASIAVLATASRSIPVSAALLATLTRNPGASVALIQTLNRTFTTNAALTLPGVKFRDIPCSATLSGGSRMLLASAALRRTQTRTIPCSASISISFEGLQIGIPASTPLQSTSSRFVMCMVALLASNATVFFRSGVADIRMRSGTVNIIVK